MASDADRSPKTWSPRNLPDRSKMFPPIGSLVPTDIRCEWIGVCEVAARASSNMVPEKGRNFNKWRKVWARIISPGDDAAMGQVVLSDDETIIDAESTERVEMQIPKARAMARRRPHSQSPHDDFDPMYIDDHSIEEIDD